MAYFIARILERERDVLGPRVRVVKTFDTEEQAREACRGSKYDNEDHLIGHIDGPVRKGEVLD